MKNFPKYHNQVLFDQAFTHRSYLNEAKEKIESNERMEFLGDSILSFVVSDYLYKTYPQFDEGILTNLRSLIVNTKSLAAQSKKLEFGKLLKLSRGEEESKGRENESLLANCFESYLGGLYLDQGIEAARAFVAEQLLPQIEDYVQKKAFKDPKSMLQEYVQAQRYNSPVYKVMHEEGPPHAKIFTIGVYVNDELKGEGIGKSKQEGEEKAAEVALEKVK
ncbi:MAG TPA: ribonuclease III [Patescibacteria group bacterium]|nr:ribonuclease III [Patescibacteria group bacterium]